MCTTCRNYGPGTEPALPKVAQSLSLADLDALSSRNAARLKARSVGISSSALVANSALHTTADGGVFLTTSSIDELQGDTTLTGTIGPIPVELHLSVKLDPVVGTVTVTLEFDKPIHLGPFTWTFKLGGMVRDANNQLIGAQTITLSADTPAFAGSGVGAHFLCFLKCAGLAIAPILLECVPSLAGGPQGFISCVVGKAGSGAASIAACVAKCV